MEEDICIQYLSSKSKIQDEKDLPKVLSLLAQADPDPKTKIIENNQFIFIVNNKYNNFIYLFISGTTYR